MGLQSGTSSVKTDVDSTTSPDCSSSLCALKFHVLDFLLDNLKKLKSFSLTYASPFEHFHEP